jgi:hypothetical protein
MLILFEEIKKKWKMFNFSIPKFGKNFFVQKIYFNPLTAMNRHVCSRFSQISVLGMTRNG